MSTVLLDLRLTDDEFLKYCAEHEDLRVESNARGEIEIQDGVGPDTGRRYARLAYRLGDWDYRRARGYGFASTTLFVLPNGARRSPDCSWMSRERAALVPREQQDGLWHSCPEFVIEMRLPGDRLSALEERMVEWTGNGAELGWLIDPIETTVTVYRPGREPERLAAPAFVEGEGPVDGFRLDLAEIW